MKTIFINLPHKLTILFFFAITYAPVLYFQIYNGFNNVLMGDMAKSITFIWTVFILSIINIVYRLVLKYTQNYKFTKFLIRVNAEYGKIYSGLFLTAAVFIIQAAVVNWQKISVAWSDKPGGVILAVLISVSAFLIFPALAAVGNYFLVKYFRTALWAFRPKKV